jgi:Subtilase family
MKKAIWRAGLVSVLVTLTLGFTAGVGGAAPDPFATSTSTSGGYLTWDADQINVEKVTQTGKGVYVAVLDTGLMPNWADYFPKDRVATSLGTGFEQQVTFKSGSDPCGLETEIGPLRQSTWVGSLGSSHGTHVASTILGYSYRANADAAGGYVLPPIQVRGIAPDVTVIPVKVLSDYQVPARPQCTDPNVDPTAHNVVFGTDEMVAAGIDYVTSLADRGIKPIVINMSLGGDTLAAVEKAAIDRAIEHGVIVVAAAGNEGELGMHFPGAYAPVISAGASGWTGEWLNPVTGLPLYRLWWLQDRTMTGPGTLGLPAGSGDVADPTSVNDVYVTDFSSRELTPQGQDLDVLAPGSWVRGPFAGDPGYSHLPWNSSGIGDLRGHNPGNFYYVGGTSMATPHVASAAAMLLEKSDGLTQSEVETILETSALPIPSTGTRHIYDRTVNAFADVSWDTLCEAAGDVPCDPVGSGLLQVDQAIAQTP